MQIIQIIPLSILKSQYKNDWIYELSFWQGIALSLLKIKQYGKVALYTDQEGFEVLINQIHLPYDEVKIIQNNTSDFSVCVVDILSNAEECIWVSSDIYALKNLSIIEKNAFYLWHADPSEMLSASRIYENHSLLKSLFHRPHNWDGYFIFEGIFQHNKTFWAGYDSLLKEIFQMDNSLAKNYYTDYRTTDRFILKYLLSVYARKNEYMISENLNKIARQHLYVESIIQNLYELPLIQATDELKKSVHFNDLISYLLFEESPTVFHKIQNIFKQKDTDQDPFFIRTQQCSMIMDDFKKRSSLTADIFKYEKKRKRFITNISDMLFDNYSPFQSTQFLLNTPITTILEGKWQLNDNHIVIESKWKWDMNENTNLDIETYAKLKIYYNKSELSGFHHTLIMMNRLNGRVSEVHLDILQVLVLYYLKKPKKVKAVIKWIEKAIFEQENIPFDFKEKCIEAMKPLALMNCIEKI